MNQICLFGFFFCFLFGLVLFVLFWGFILFVLVLLLHVAICMLLLLHAIEQMTLQTFQILNVFAFQFTLLKVVPTFTQWLPPVTTSVTTTTLCNFSIELFSCATLIFIAECVITNTTKHVSECLISKSAY